MTVSEDDLRTPAAGPPLKLIQRGYRSDRELVDALAAGDPAAMTEVVSRCRSAVRIAAARKGVDPATVEDIAQEVFLALWRHPEKWNGVRGALNAYLTTMAKNRTIDLLRSQSARQAREAGGDPDIAEDVETHVMGAAAARDVRKAVSSLPEHQRRPIALTFFGYRTYREAAIELGLPEGTVKSQIRSGLLALRPLLDANQSSYRSPLSR
ncbi:MAG: sigma-70 family RNA polymerase sigma factor [Acidimicrobiales bacterium]